MRWSTGTTARVTVKSFARDRFLRRPVRFAGSPGWADTGPKPARVAPEPWLPPPRKARGRGVSRRPYFDLHPRDHTGAHALVHLARDLCPGKVVAFEPNVFAGGPGDAEEQPRVVQRPAATHQGAGNPVETHGGRADGRGAAWQTTPLISSPLTSSKFSALFQESSVGQPQSTSTSLETGQPIAWFASLFLGADDRGHPYSSPFTRGAIKGEGLTATLFWCPLIL